EGVLAALERAQAPDDVQEHLAEEVLRIRRAASPQVAEHRRRHGEVQLAPRPVAARTSGGQNLLELFPQGDPIPRLGSHVRCIGAQRSQLECARRLTGWTPWAPI